MALEVARRLIDNVWRTVIADEDSGGGGGGSGSALTVLGPYTVDFDSDPDVNNDYFFVPGSDLVPDGFWIMDSLVEITQGWTDGAGGGFTWLYRLGLSPVGNIGYTEWFNRLDPAGTGGNIMNDAPGLTNDIPQERTFLLRMAEWGVERSISIASVKFGMEIYSNRGPFTAGQLRITVVGFQT